MVDRVEVFVDTSYLLASFYNSWTTGARAQLEIDLPAVTDHLNTIVSNKLHLPVHRQLWYDGIPDSGPHRYQRTLRHIDGVQLRAGQLIEWGDRRTQKAVDTRLVADMVLRSIRGLVSDIVLVSGDADMIPGVEAAIDHGVRVHLIGFGWDSISSALRHACDTTTVLDPRTDFHDAMQIRVLEGPIPPKVRTPTATPAHPGEDGHDPDTHESVDLMEVDLRADRAAATSVADETRLTIADEERAADAEELAVDEQECATRIESEGDEQEAASPGEDAATPAPRPEEPAVVTPADLAPKPGPTPQASPSPAEHAGSVQKSSAAGGPANGSSRPNPSMMAPHRRPLRSKFVPLPEEVWTSSGEQTPFDVGQQYATWWYEQAATEQQRDEAHLLSGGVLPPAIDRPLLQFACQMLNEFTLTEAQRVRLRDGFHEGIRAVLLKHR